MQKREPLGEQITLSLPRDKAAFLRRLLGAVRAIGTETDSKSLQHFFSPYEDWIEHIDHELGKALAHNDTSEDCDDQTKRIY
jgi:hypothetical protein